jgi:nucleoid DNA-binding protein
LKQILIKKISEQTGIETKTVKDVLNALPNALASILNSESRATLYGVAVFEFDDPEVKGRPPKKGKILRVRPTVTFQKKVS